MCVGGGGKEEEEVGWEEKGEGGEGCGKGIRTTDKPIHTLSFLVKKRKQRSLCREVPSQWNWTL